MRTMIDVRKCGSLRSMRHISSRPYEDKSVPHLTLYVQQMTKTKLLKEREVMRGRLEEIEKQLGHIDNLILTLRPKLGLPEPAVKRGRSRKAETDEGSSRVQKYRTKKMKMSF